MTSHGSMWPLLVLSALLARAAANIIVYTQDIPHVIAEEFRDLPSSFGGDLPPEGLRAFLVVGAPEDGCAPIAKPPAVDNFTGRWAVLLARYNCSFEAKVRAAQEAGFDVAIVHNVNSNDLETMSAKDPEGITIPSVFVSDLAGTILATQYTYTDGYYIMVNGDLPFNINTHLLLPFAIVVALCLLVMVVFMIVKCIKDRRRARRHRLPARSLSKIPICKFSKGDPYDTCAVCLDDYQEGDRLRVLPCAHAYHAKCIDPWLTENRRVCPVCKRRVLAAGERRGRRGRGGDSDSDSSQEPLRPAARDDVTQGGTFEPQSENPFARAARFMARLRRSRPTEEAPEEDTASPEVEHDDTAPLLAPSVRVEQERPRRGRRGRRARSAVPTTNTEPAPAQPPALSSSVHSINAPETEAETGEIGVAALPATDLSATHIRL